MLSRMSPFTAAGVDYIKKILVGRGPAPKYHYTQYVGGNITEKYIPYESAGVLLRGQIADLKAYGGGHPPHRPADAGDHRQAHGAAEHHPAGRRRGCGDLGQGRI